jgi:hypothetical protein
MNLMDLRNLLIVFCLTAIAFAYPRLTEAEFPNPLKQSTK